MQGIIQLNSTYALHRAVAIYFILLVIRGRFVEKRWSTRNNSLFTLNLNMALNTVEKRKWILSILCSVRNLMRCISQLSSTEGVLGRKEPANFGMKCKQAVCVFCRQSIPSG